MTEYPQIQNQSPVALPKRLWLHGFMVGLALVILGLASWYFLSGNAPVATSLENKPGQPAQVKPEQNSSAAAPQEAGQEEQAAVLKAQLEQVLSGLKEANQKKDLSQLLSYYSPNFPQLTQRAQTISKTWKIYDYSQIEFELKEVDLKKADTAVARVVWTATARNIDTKSVNNISKTYQVTFVREAGHWHIKALEGIPH